MDFLRRPVASGRPSIGIGLHERVEKVLREHPEMGYSSTAELVKDLLRRWLEGQDDPPRAAVVSTAADVDEGQD